MGEKIYTFLRKLCSDPEAMMPMEKRTQLIDYKLLKEDSFSFIEWKRPNFVVVKNMLRIIDITLEILPQLDKLAKEKQTSQIFDVEEIDSESKIQRKINKFITLDEIPKSVEAFSDKKKLQLSAQKRSNKKRNTLIPSQNSYILNKYSRQRKSSVILPHVTKSFNEFDT